MIHHDVYKKFSDSFELHIIILYVVRVFSAVLSKPAPRKWAIGREARNSPAPLRTYTLCTVHAAPIPANSGYMCTCCVAATSYSVLASVSLLSTDVF
jgi:hypothetical protein